LIPLRESVQGISFAVRVQPRASRPGIRGVLGEGDGAALKLALTAPPLDGRANRELVEYFSGLFHVPQFSVDVIAGLQSRNKVVRITGLSMKQVRVLLNQAIDLQGI
jgi:uncharacterized protein